MNKLLVGSLLVLAGAVSFGQGVPLQQGQSYTFEFTSIPNLRPALSVDPVQVIAWFEPGTFGAANARLEIFPNNLFDTPLTNSVAMVEYPDRVGLPYWWSTFGPHADPPFFPDLQGVLRVTMLSGSARLSAFEVDQIINGDFYSGYFTVPEPAVASLFAAALVLFRLRKPR